MKENKNLLTWIVVILLINSVALLLIGYNTFNVEDEVEVEAGTEAPELLEIGEYTMDSCEALVWEIESKRKECNQEALLRLWDFTKPENNDAVVKGLVEDACWESFPHASEVWAKCLEKIK